MIEIVPMYQLDMILGQFLVAKQLNIWTCMSVCLSVSNFSYIVREVNEVDELDKGNISAAEEK